MTLDEHFEYMEIQRIIQNKSFWVYGCGLHATKFYNVLKKNNTLGNLKGFILTRNIYDNDLFFGKPVISVDKAPKNEWIFIAANIVNSMEIYDILQKFHFKKVKPIYWSLFNLIYGLPVKENKKFSAKELFLQSEAANFCAICYLVIEGYFLKNNIGNDLYVKFLTYVNVDFDVAKKDCERFLSRISKCEKNGFSQEYNIKIEKNEKRIIDGNHRIALAQYFGIDSLCADIYDCDDEKDFIFFGEGGYINYSALNFIRKIFSFDEVAIIENVFNRIK